MKHFVLWIKVVLAWVLMAPGTAQSQEVAVSGGREPNHYTATVSPGVVANTDQAIPFSLTLINVTPDRHKDGGCGDDHDDGGCGDDHDDGGCGDDHDDGGCGDDHDDGGCGDDHDDGGCGGGSDKGGSDGGCGDDHDDGGCDGGCSDKASGPGSMAIKKITLWLPEGINISQMHNISYYTMPCGRQWTRTELDATDRIVFVAAHGSSHRLGRDQAFVLTFDLLTSTTGELQWVTGLSHCPGKSGRAFQLVTMPGNQPTDVHPLTVLYSPGKEQLAGGGFILAGQPHGSHAPAPGTKMHFTLSAKYQQRGARTGLKGHVNLVYQDAEGTRWRFESREPLALGINTAFEPGVAAASFTARGTLMAGLLVLDDVVLQATLVDRGAPGRGDEAAFTLRQHNTLLMASHWEHKTIGRQPLAGGNIIIIGGGTEAGIGVLQAEAQGPAESLMPLEGPQLQVTAWPNPFCEKLHFSFTPEKDARLVLELYDMSGRLIITLIDQYSLAGEPHQVEYVPQGQKPGMILYRLSMDGAVHTGRVLYQK